MSRCGHTKTPPFCDGSHEECKFEYSKEINKDTEKVIEDMTIDKDGSYILDISSKNEIGIVWIQILKDNNTIISVSGKDYNATNNLYLKKGDYQIVIECYLDNLEEILPTPITAETLKRLNLTGDLEEYSEVNVFVGVR